MVYKHYDLQHNYFNFIFCIPYVEHVSMYIIFHLVLINQLIYAQLRILSCLLTEEQ
jgi:hypothetical protein